MGKKILIINAGLHISGVTRVMINMANALAERGHEVTIKTVTADDELGNLLDPRIRHELLLKEPRLLGKRIPGWLRSYYASIERLFKKPAAEQYKRIVTEKYDVEIAFNRGVGARVIAASTNKDAKKLVWVHNDYTLCDNPYAGFEGAEDAAEAYKRFDKIVCVSEQSQRAFTEKFGISENVITRYNVNDEQYMLQSEVALDIQKKRFTIAAVGRLSAQKAYDILLNACRLLNDDGIEYDLWIIGDGEDKEKLLKLKESLKLTNVSLLGAKPNPYSYLKLADLYVSSSIYEGLSTTTIESLIMGVPAVVTDCTGMRDILGDSEYGMIVPIDAQSLYEGMKKMMTDDKLRNTYKEKCAQRAKDFYKDATIKAIEDLF